MQGTINTAIKRLQSFCPPEGYYLAFSGGKDSLVLKQLADEAAVPYDAHYNVTILQYSDVIWDRPQRTMWQLIVRLGMPPTRTARYCCRELKERGGIGRIVALG